MNESDMTDKEVHEGTKTLQQIAEDVERERKQKGHSALDVTIDPSEEDPEDNNLSENDEPLANDVEQTETGAAAKIFTKNSPQH